mmetsp:Transcript_13129/g.23636  ORF Transcript_13129/g.23636 Transcript_13129/m.23636 type:complete len:96 (+) Transcript_13129:755-1042(+)
MNKAKMTDSVIGHFRRLINGESARQITRLKRNHSTPEDWKKGTGFLVSARKSAKYKTWWIRKRAMYLNWHRIRPVENDVGVNRPEIKQYPGIVKQ